MRSRQTETSPLARELEELRQLVAELREEAGELDVEPSRRPTLTLIHGGLSEHREGE